jgi:hypothetical protein
LRSSQGLKQNAASRDAIEVSGPHGVFELIDECSLETGDEEDVVICVVEVGGHATEAEQGLFIGCRSLQGLDLVEAEDHRQRLAR